VNQSVLSERTARRDHFEDRGQRGDAGLVGARDACAVTPAGIAFLQPFAVSLGMSSTLAATVGGAFFEACNATLPKVTLKLAVIDSESIRARIEAQTLDLAMVFEDEFVPAFSRKLLFRQRLYLVRRDPLPDKAISVSFDKLATLALIPESSKCCAQLARSHFRRGRHLA
jgi:hypothetical protein